MQVILSLLSIIGSIISGRLFKEIFQIYRNYKQKKDIESAKIEAQNDNKKANEESDMLKEIEDAINNTK